MEPQSSGWFWSVNGKAKCKYISLDRWVPKVCCTLESLGEILYILTSNVVPASVSSCTQLPQTQGFKATRLYSFTILEVRSVTGASRAVLPLEARGRVHSLPAPGSRSHLYCLSCGSFLHLQSQQQRLSFLFSHLCFHFLQSDPPASLLSGHWADIEPTWISQDPLPISRPFT